MPDIVRATRSARWSARPTSRASSAGCGSGRRRRSGARNPPAGGCPAGGRRPFEQPPGGGFPAAAGHRPVVRKLCPAIRPVATDLATSRESWLQSGPIHKAVCASIALPGILSPGQQRRLCLAGLVDARRRAPDLSLRQVLCHVPENSELHSIKRRIGCLGAVELSTSGRRAVLPTPRPRRSHAIGPGS
jgi:hypothetical protein